MVPLSFTATESALWICGAVSLPASVEIIPAGDTTRILELALSAM